MHQVTLDPVEKVKLTWMVDWPEKNVFFQVKNGINDKYSWFALGFSHRGEFPLTDFCIFQRENDRIDSNIVSYKSSFLLFTSLNINYMRLAPHFFFGKFLSFSV
jgi:hypothetical protein